MDALNELKLEQQLRGAAKKPPEYQWTQTDLNEAWRKITAPILGLMESLANLPDSVEIVGANQRILPRELTDLATMSPKELLELCGQLREVWTALAALADQQKKLVRGKAQGILQTWWESYPLAVGPHWNVYYQTGTFFPTHRNYRALIARVCFDNRDFLGRCGNLECKDKPYFIKPRRNSKFCKGCRRYDALQRVKKSQAKKRQSARKGKGRA